jgi:hypothetical protein
LGEKFKHFSFSWTREEVSVQCEEWLRQLEIVRMYRNGHPVINRELRLVLALVVSLGVTPSWAYSASELNDRQRSLAEEFVKDVAKTQCKPEQRFNYLIQDRLSLIESKKQLARTLSRVRKVTQTEEALEADELTEGLTGNIFLIADNSLKLGCLDLADEYYRKIINIFVGAAYVAYRQRAQVGIEDVRVERQRVQQGGSVAPKPSSKVNSAANSATMLAEQLDKRVDSRNAKYAILEERPATNCIFRNGERVSCVTQPNYTFGKRIQTKDYDIIPVYGNCGGSGCPFSSTELIIESKNTFAVARELAEFCLECSLHELGAGAIQIDYAANQAIFQLGAVKGYRVQAVFQNGSISVKKVEISQEEPLSDGDCNFLYEYLGECARTEHEFCADPGQNFAMALVRPYFGFVHSYPKFPKQPFEKSCSLACTERRAPQRADFMSRYCKL